LAVNSAHERYLQLLYKRAGKRYPSHRILERIESGISDRQDAERYVAVLLDEAETQAYPSLHMLDRVRRMVARMAVADEIQRIERELAAAEDDESEDDS
jgi:uncharacterized protein (UPF0248 family)